MWQQTVGLEVEMKMSIKMVNCLVKQQSSFLSKSNKPLTNLISGRVRNYTHEESGNKFHGKEKRIDKQGEC